MKHAMNPATSTLLLVALLVTGCARAPGDTARSDQAASATGTPPAAQPAASTTGAEAATAVGTVESVDAATGKITIAHGPVSALGWPAMTMPFDATPDQVASVKAGDRVEFAFDSKTYALVRIAPKR